jgi:CubicO group peptidase (beta-lactamase class C family)
LGRSRSAQLRRVGRDRPPRGACAPGERFFYNNWDFNALGAVFETLSGLSVAEGMAAWIAAPTGMAFRAGDGRVIHEPVSRHGAHHGMPPTNGVTVFPREIVRPSRRWVEKVYTNLCWFEEVERGGHFAAFEQPGTFVDQLRGCFRPFR